MTYMPKPQTFGGPRDPSYPAPAELLHVSIAHSGPGVEELIHFYCIVLNMRHVYTLQYPSFDFIALSNDDENHRIGIVNSKTGEGLAIAQNLAAPEATAASAEGLEPRREPLRKCRIEHTSWLYHRFEDVLATARQVHKELGIWPRTARHQGGGITIDYSDPDGNRVELLSQAGTRAQILWTIEQRLGPQGGVDVRNYTDTYKPFSMQKMIALWENGMPIDQLKDAGFCQKLVAEGRL
jgi:catechol 2,3-dioxygenase-like lactoylglutathione lyase family enzyme